MPGGFGLTWRQLLAALKELPAEELAKLLDEGIIVVGAEGGYEFIDNLTPLDAPIQTGSGPIFDKGRLVLKLQDGFIEYVN